MLRKSTEVYISRRAFFTKQMTMANFDLNFNFEELSPMELLQTDFPEQLLPNYGQNIAVPVNNNDETRQNDEPSEAPQNADLLNLEQAVLPAENFPENQQIDENEEDEDDGRWRKVTKKRIDKTADASVGPNTHYQTKWAVKVFKGTS